jgi:hypothetical protein
MYIFIELPPVSSLSLSLSLGDAIPLGDAESSLGDAKSSLGDGESSLGDVKSSLADVKSSLVDAERARWVTFRPPTPPAVAPVRGVWRSGRVGVER